MTSTLQVGNVALLAAATRPALKALGVALLLSLCLVPLVSAQPKESVSARETVRGVTISTHRAGQEWGSEAIDSALDELVALGANWVAIHPYAWIRADGTVEFWELDSGRAPAYLRRPIEQAHARGLQILIKPHLGYWGSPFRWRGEIAFDDESAWRRFFDSYERWIVAIARATTDADAFAIGTELDRTVDRPEWGRILAEVDRHTGSALTYAANWTDYRRVPFWHLLDAIGIQAYFPISEVERPDAEALRTGWRQRMAEVSEFSRGVGKPIVFTELGYNRSWRAAREPWEARTDGPDAEVLQQLCTQIALEAVEDEPTVVGAFLWKWFVPPRSVGRDFQLASPAMRRVIRDVWERRSRSD